MAKCILYKRTIMMGAGMYTFGNVWEDVSLEVITVDLGVGRRLWRQGAGSIMLQKKTTRKSFSTRSQ